MATTIETTTTAEPTRGARPTRERRLGPRAPEPVSSRERVGRVVPFPKIQQLETDWLELERHQHLMHGLFEVDVTETRRAIRAYRARTGTPLSLTAFLVHCLACAVAADPAMQAYRLGRRRLVLFPNVDVGIMVEREVEGSRIPLGVVIRAADTKDLGAIQREIRAAQNTHPETVATRAFPRWLRPLLVRGLTAWLALPAVFRRLIWAWAIRDPYRRKRLQGTVGLTAVGMFGRGAGWGLAPMNHTLTLVVGGLAHKPGLVAGRIAEREYLCLTLTLDHDVIEGAPAARFVRRLTDLIECGAGLQAPAPEAARLATPR